MLNKILLSLIFPASLMFAQTDVSGDVSGIWGLEGSPYNSPHTHKCQIVRITNILNIINDIFICAKKAHSSSIFTAKWHIRTWYDYCLYNSEGLSTSKGYNG